MNIYICSSPICDHSFDSFGSSIRQDDKLENVLLNYIYDKDYEIFERRFNVAVTEAGWFGAFYDYELGVDDSKKIGSIIDAIDE